MKQKLKRLWSEIEDLKKDLALSNRTVPLRETLKMAQEALVTAIHESVRLDDPVENSPRYGTGERCICPHCGELIKELFDDVYMLGEHYEMTCPHCEASYSVAIDNVYALVSIVLHDASDGVCQRCFHWQHAAGKCEPYRGPCACQENTE